MHRIPIRQQPAIKYDMKGIVDWVKPGIERCVHDGDEVRINVVVRFVSFCLLLFARCLLFCRSFVVVC
jgi:hypothetical protein